MKKMLLLLLMVGILILGTFYVVEGVCENNSPDDVNFSDSGSFQDLGYEGVVTNGEGGAGGGGGGSPG